MRTWRYRAAGGFTMTELLVVMSIIVILVAAAVPTFARLGVFSRGDMQNTARELYNLLTAARIYASTYRVNTAVAYDYADIGDSVTGGTARALRAAALLYQYPRPDGDPNTFFAPIPGRDIFRPFPGRCVILLGDPADDAPLLGLTSIDAYMQIDWSDEEDPLGARMDLPAHVFLPSGRMKLDESTRQRFRLLVTPSPDDRPEDRLIDPDNRSLASNLRAIPLDLYQATGRVKMGS